MRKKKQKQKKTQEDDSDTKDKDLARLLNLFIVPFQARFCCLVHHTPFMQVFVQLPISTGKGVCARTAEDEKSLAEATGRLGLQQHLTAVPLCLPPTSRGPVSPGGTTDPADRAPLRSPPPALARRGAAPAPPAALLGRPRPGPARAVTSRLPRRSEWRQLCLGGVL